MFNNYKKLLQRYEDVSSFFLVNSSCIAITFAVLLLIVHVAIAFSIMTPPVLLLLLKIDKKHGKIYNVSSADYCIVSKCEIFR